MAGERLHQIILAPVVSEKSTRLSEMPLEKQYVFKVLRDSRKPEIKRAVELMFNVKVQDVRTLNVKGKTKRFGRSEGVRSDWKKAYVTLAEGQQIDLLAAAAA
ncbi:MAG: 50S ribosomal protein L23 [Nevskia sp.]|nr:50S ribosomal protein L23 [Nevskia sp.]